MTWRRFLTLLRGLSPHSASVTSASSRTEFGSKERAATAKTPEQAQSMFVSLFGHARARAS